MRSRGFIRRLDRQSAKRGSGSLGEGGTRNPTMRSQQVATLPLVMDSEEAGLGGVVGDIVVEILDEISVTVRMQ